jgi:Protein of unknown function (DUF3551)
MRKSLITGLTLWVAFAAFAGKGHAEVSYPWCIMGDTRGYECVFSSREQCVQDGRNRGFGGQCIQNPFYKPGPPTVSGPVDGPPKKRAASDSAAANGSTCSGLKALCLSRTDCGEHCYMQPMVCNAQWNNCMKSGFWSGSLMSRRAERR